MKWLLILDKSFLLNTLLLSKSYIVYFIIECFKVQFYDGVDIGSPQSKSIWFCGIE